MMLINASIAKNDLLLQISIQINPFQIHVLSDIIRGATVEAVIARMKTIQAAKARTKLNNSSSPFRFIAVSATIPNIEDVRYILAKHSRNLQMLHCGMH
jgi:superfamily II helicase